MDYQQCMSYLQHNGVESNVAGIQRAQFMMSCLGDLHKKMKFVHIAGTNGKGSTAAFMDQILRKSGYRVGRYISPHLEQCTERIQINGVQISQDEFAIHMTTLIEEVVPLLMQAGLGTPKGFEVFTMIALMHFVDQVDIVVLEVGLGGRLDCTNIVAPEISIITPISMDHTQILGDTMEKIAREKAGIIKSGIPVILAPQLQDVTQIIDTIAKEESSTLYTVVLEQCETIALPGSGQKCSIKTPYFFYENLLVPLNGVYQLTNVSVAITAAQVLAQLGWGGICEKTIREGIQGTYWPGRMEYVSLEDNKGILLDGAHNTAGVEMLVKGLREQYEAEEIIFLIGILDDKAQQEMVELLVPLAKKFIITKPSYKRSTNWIQLKSVVNEIAPQCEVMAVDHIADGIEEALQQLNPNGLLCITGSLYLIGDARKILRETYPDIANQLTKEG